MFAKYYYTAICMKRKKINQPENKHFGKQHLKPLIKIAKQTDRGEDKSTTLHKQITINYLVIRPRHNKRRG